MRVPAHILGDLYFSTSNLTRTLLATSGTNDCYFGHPLDKQGIEDE